MTYVLDASAQAELMVNAVVDGVQMFSDVAALTDGGYVATWASTQNGTDWDVYARRFDAASTPLGDAVRVNMTVETDQLFTDAAALQDGGYVVTWTSAQNGVDGDIYAQRFDAAGVPTGAEFRVNMTQTYNQLFSDTIGLADGGFLVTWSSLQNGVDSDIYAQRYDAAGTPVGAEVRVNTAEATDQMYSHAAPLADGGYVVTWSSDQNGVDTGVYAQRFDAAGAPVGAEFRVNTTEDFDQGDSRVTALADGGFLITWLSSQSGTDWDVYAQRYDAAGMPVGAEFRVNTTTTLDQLSGDAAALADGGFLVAWASAQNGTDWDVYSQRYDATGVAVSNEVIVNQTTIGNQTNASVTVLRDGDVVHSWEGSGTADDGGVFVLTHDWFFV